MNRRAAALTMLLAMGGCESATPAPPSTPTAPLSASATASSPGPGSDASRVIASARAGAWRCYQQGLGREPEQEGKAAFLIKVTTSGAVSQVQMTPTGSLTEEVMTCIHDNLAALTFAPPAGGSATIRGSFTFVNGALHPRAK